MKKKMLSILLASTMTLALTACGSSASSSTDSAESDAAASESSTEETADSADSGERKTLKVAMECGYAPYNWTQADDSNGAVPINDSSDYAYGYDVMMAKLIAEQLGYDLEIVKLDWDSLVPAVQSGTVDCVIAGQSITSERLQMVDFSDPYYYASIVGLVKTDGAYADAAGVADLAGATCTSQLGTVWYDVCLPQIQDAEIQPAQESAPAMLVALESGRTDLIVTDMPTAMAAEVAYPDLKLLDFSGTEDDFEVSEEEINIGVSVQKGNTELLDGINSVLATLTTDDFDKMMEEAISVQPLSE
jgi:putative lysine transport system substrate-binding protein